MSMLSIKIVDVTRNNKLVDVEKLTDVGAESLISECEELLDKLKEIYRKGGD